MGFGIVSLLMGQTELEVESTNTHQNWDLEDKHVLGVGKKGYAKTTY